MQISDGNPSLNITALQMGDEAVLTERPQNDKAPKNFLVLNLAPASEAATVKAPSQQPMQRDAAAVSPPLAGAAAEP